MIALLNWLILTAFTSCAHLVAQDTCKCRGIKARERLYWRCVTNNDWKRLMTHFSMFDELSPITTATDRCIKILIEINTTAVHDTRAQATATFAHFILMYSICIIRIMVIVQSQLFVLFSAIRQWFPFLGVIKMRDKRYIPHWIIIYYKYRISRNPWNLNLCVFEISRYLPINFHYHQTI